MARRLPLVQLLSLSLVALLVVGCYSPPTPTCGFECGDNNSCPPSYTCNTSDRICHLDGTDDTCDPAPPDPGLPVTSTVMPSDGATDVPTNATVVIELSISYATGTTIDDSRMQVLAANGQPIAGLVMAGSFDAQVVFTPNHLPNASLVTAQLLPGLETQDGRPIGGRVWTFTTENDVTPPTMTGSVPTTGSTDVPQFGENIKLTFDEDVQNAETGGLSITTSDGPVSGNWFYDPTGPYHIATFFPVGALPADKIIQVFNETSLTDYAGNPVTPFTVSLRTAADTTPPFVLMTTPLNNDANIPTNTTIVVDFDDTVTNVDTTTFRVDNAGTPITGTIASDTAGAVYVFTPDAALPAATTITVTLETSIADVAGNQLGMPYTFEFTTAP